MQGNNDQIAMLQTRVRELEADAEASKQELTEATQQLQEQQQALQ